jgi:hypothetical protein
MACHGGVCLVAIFLMQEESNIVFCSMTLLFFSQNPSCPFRLCASKLRSSSFSFINVGVCGFHCLRSYFFSDNAQEGGLSSPVPARARSPIGGIFQVEQVWIAKKRFKAKGRHACDQGGHLYSKSTAYTK